MEINMTANNQATDFATVASAVAAPANPASAPDSVAATLPTLYAGDVCNVVVTRVVHGKDGNPFLLRCKTDQGHNGTLHVSNLKGDERAHRDARIAEFEVNDPLTVEVLESAPELRFSERLFATRQAISELQHEEVLTGRVLEDVKEGSDSVFITVCGHRARLHASKLNEPSRDARDARMKAFKKDDHLNVVITSYRRHPKLPVIQVDCSEYGWTAKVEKSSEPDSQRAGFPQQFKRRPGPSPLGNKTGDRAKAEAKRAERRNRDQETRNKMKSSGGKK
jgi:hypothetical protein